MNYANHNLRTLLQESKNRLSKATYEQFGNQLKYVISFIENNKQLKALLDEAVALHPFKKDTFDSIMAESYHLPEMSFADEADQAAYCYQFLTHMLVKTAGNYKLHTLNLFQRRDFDDTKSGIIEDFISPMIYFLHDKLDKHNATIFLLEKYKKRTEWFTRDSLYATYINADKNYEQILEDDLRLFLFDQGIDYPFSTPLSASGRADIIGEIETDDPLIIEIKIFDKNRGYGKDRIKDGFSQVIKYANDYNKDVGYLVVFNMNDVAINFKFNEPTKIFPPSLHFNNKQFYFVIINCFSQTSASKTGTTTEIAITEEELTKK